MEQVRITFTTDPESLELDEVASGIPVVSIGEPQFSSLVAQLNGVWANSAIKIPEDCREITIRPVYHPRLLRRPLGWRGVLALTAILVVAFAIIGLMSLGAYKLAELLGPRNAPRQRAADAAPAVLADSTISSQAARGADPVTAY